MSRTNICKNIVQSIKDYITDQVKLEPHRVEKHFVRRRKLSLLQVIIYLFFSSKASMFQNLSQIREELGTLSFPDVSKQALSKARQFINPSLFKELYYLSVDLFYSQIPSRKLWQGYHLFAVDGSRIELPNSKSTFDFFGEMSSYPDPNRRYTMGLASIIYDVLDDYILHASIHKFLSSERAAALEHLEVLEDKSYKGPIDKFIPDDMKQEIADIAGLTPGDTIFFIADREAQAALYAGQIRTELGNRLDLIEKNSYRFCYINDFPMYEYDNEEKKYIFTHNPFSMPQGGLEALNTKEPSEILAYQYDIVCNGIELSSGAVRNHDLDIMVKAFEIAGYTEEDLKEKFGALYNAFQFGAPPHAGMAPGVDRMIMLLRNEENIREIIPFPMNGNAQDLMCGAPNEVSEQQLREVHIKVRQ